MPLETEHVPETATTAMHAMHSPSNIFARTTVVGEWLLFVVLAAYMAAHTLPHAWRKLNTDFPNYYLTAHLAHAGDTTNRIYEWIWIQRQKDHLAIAQPIVGMVPITPFSTLAVWPLSSLPALTAKHWWLALTMGMLAVDLILLQSMTRLPWRRILLVAALCFPLYANLLYGQYYVLLLFVLTLACWLHLRQRRFWAGMMVGLAFGLKIFPILYLLYFLRKRDWKAFEGGVVGSMAVATASIGVFGWALNRVYVAQVLPWALRGEGTDPYNLQASSISSLLHRLFIYEPQRNPHPALNAPWLLAVLIPLLQLVVFAPALLFATPKSTCSRRVRLEWAAILLASLAISTSPAFYDFTLLILPVCFVWEALQSQERRLATAALLFLYLAVGYPKWKTPTGTGWLALLGVPRLYAIVLLCIFSYMVLWWQDRAKKSTRDMWVWSAVLACGLALSISNGLRHQHGLYRNYQWRLAAPGEMYLATHPVVDGRSVLFTAMLPDGYRTGEESNGSVHFRASAVDDLAVAAGGGRQWIEEGQRRSQIISIGSNQMEIDDAEFPVASSDGKRVAYLREDHGRARIWMRALEQAAGEDKPMTPSGLDVLEMSFLPDDGLVFSATSGNGRPGLFLVNVAGNVSPFLTEETRYPAVSPDGRWLAYSRLQGGNWHLWIRKMDTGETRRITDADCNNVEPAWEADSRTLVYASDCGRQLWFTALCRRRVLP